MIMGISARSDIGKIWLYDWKKRMNTGKLRNDSAFVPELDFVMLLDGEIIGQNMF